MSKERLRMRLIEKGRLRETWEEKADPDSDKSLRFALLAAIEALGVEERDAREALPRFELEFQGQTGGWRSFRAVA